MIRNLQRSLFVHAQPPNNLQSTNPKHINHMKNFLLKTWLIMVCLVCGAGLSWAQVYTLDATLDANKGKNSSYTSSGDVTVGGITWNCAGNMSLAPWRIGGNSVTAADRAVYTKTAYESALSQIDLTVGAASNITVNSLKLVYSTSADFSNASEVAGTFAANSTISFKPASGDFPAGSYYKFVFNVTVSVTNNKFVEFKKVEFYGGSGSGAATLQSISLSGNYKTAFFTGDEFSFGGTVTANYDDNGTKDVTGKTKFTGYNLSTTGQQTVTASYTEGEVTKTATYNITVSDFTATAGTYTIDINKDFYGIETTGNNATEQSAEKWGVTVVSGCKSSASSKTYYAADHIRYYVDSYLKLTAPTGYVLTKVEFVEPTSDKNWGAEGITVNAGTYTNSTKTWTGATSNVDFSFSKQCRAAAVIVTYEEAGDVVVPTLEYIEAVGEAVALMEQQAFNHNGITIMAHWSDGTQTDVTASCTFTGHDPNTAGEQTITVTYQDKTTTYKVDVINNHYESLAQLVTYVKPTAAGEIVTVDLNNEVITGIFKTNKGARNGIFFNVNGQEVEIYCANVPGEWVVGGKISGTLTNCTWKLYNSTWELCPKDWSELTYTAPAEVQKYTVTMAPAEHGSLVVMNGEQSVTSGSQVVASTRLTFELTPEDGYEVEKLEAIVGENVNELKATNYWDVNADVTFKAYFKEIYKAPNVTWDLTKDETTDASAENLTWKNHKEVSMEALKASAGTATNNYYPGVLEDGKPKYSSTRFYANSTLTFAPANGITMASIVYTATSEAYANVMSGSTWTNASAKVDGTLVTITPVDGTKPVVATVGGTTGAKSVVVYYTGEYIYVEPTYYTISIDENIKGGSVSADLEKAEEGTKVTLSATPDKDWQFDSWNVRQADSDETISVSSNVFTMPAGNVVVSAVFKSSKYIDENGNLVLTYNFNDPNDFPEDFPVGATPAHTAMGEMFVISGNRIRISAPDNYYALNSGKSNQCLMLGKTKVGENNTKEDNTAYLEFPQKNGYKLVKVVVTTSSSVAGGISLWMFDRAWGPCCDPAETKSNSKEAFTFVLEASKANTAYRLSSNTTGKNLQFDNIVLTYEPAESTYNNATIHTLIDYIDCLFYDGLGNLQEVKKIENAILQRQ